jgi:hypothetical protein
MKLVFSEKSFNFKSRISEENFTIFFLAGLVAEGLKSKCKKSEQSLTHPATGWGVKFRVE